MEMDVRIPARKPANYLRIYENLFEPLENEAIRLLEIGVKQGGSLLMWNNYFPKGLIAGIDVNKVEDFPDEPRIHIFVGRQEDTHFLDEVAQKVAFDGFDIIIDDGSHLGALTKISFWHLFNHHLKPGGLYVIEDWKCGYWDDWPDGRAATSEREAMPAPAQQRFPSHDYGMVGFVKELVDECGADQLSRGSRSGIPTQKSRFWSMTFSQGLVIVRKMCRTPPCTPRLLPIP